MEMGIKEKWNESMGEGERRKGRRINNIKDVWKIMRDTCYFSFLLKIHRKYTILHIHVYIPMLYKHTYTQYTQII